MKDILIAVTAVGLVGFAQAGEPSFYKYCEDLVGPPDGREISEDYVQYMVQDCNDYHIYGLRRDWLPAKTIAKANALAGAPEATQQPLPTDVLPQAGDGGDDGSVDGLAGGAGGEGGGVFFGEHYRRGSRWESGYYGYSYCEGLIGAPRNSRDDYTYDLIDDCVHYYQYGSRNGWVLPMIALGAPVPPTPEPAQPGEPGKPGQGGEGGKGGSLPGLSGGAGGEGGSTSTRGYAIDGRDGRSYGSGIGGEGGEAGRGGGAGSGGSGGAASSSGVGGAGGAGGSTD